MENGTAYGNMTNCKAKMVLHSFRYKGNKNKKNIEYVRVMFTIGNANFVTFKHLIDVLVNYNIRF